MHGRIDVQSSIDRSSRFRVELPLMRLPLPLDAAAPQAVTLRHIGVDDAGALECLLALGRASMVADVLGPWLPTPAEAVLVAVGALRAQPGGLAATLAKVASGRSLIGLIGATEAEADAALASGLTSSAYPTAPNGASKRWPHACRKPLPSAARRHSRRPGAGSMTCASCWSRTSS